MERYLQPNAHQPAALLLEEAGDLLDSIDQRSTAQLLDLGQTDLQKHHSSKWNGLLKNVSKQETTVRCHERERDKGAGPRSSGAPSCARSRRHS